MHINHNLNFTNIKVLFVCTLRSLGVVDQILQIFQHKKTTRKKLKSNSNVLIFLMENLCLQEENWIECM